MVLIVSQLFLYCFVIPVVSSAVDTLAANQSLSGYHTLVSRDGKFEMGFFHPGDIFSPNYYIGIWSPEGVVWVANRHTLIYDIFSSKLKIIDGNLVLLNESNSQIWSTNMISIATPAASLVLLDDGNLVLRDGSTSSLPIWQSFDHPTHAFLPGMKLGYNKRTNTNQVLTSWRNLEDPGMGLFSFEVDHNSKQFVLKWNRSVEYWAGGPWNGRLAHELNDIYNFNYIDNENESYFTYSLSDSYIYSSLTIDELGQLKTESGQQHSEPRRLPKGFCDVYGLCGAFAFCDEQYPICNCLTGFKPRSVSNWNMRDYSSGCVRKTEVKSEFILSYVNKSFLSAFHENKALQLGESA